MTSPRAAPLSVRILLLVLLLLVLEGLSYLGIWTLSRIAATPIRRTSTIYAEQTERIQELIAKGATRREQLDSALGWRYQTSFRRQGDVINAQGLRSAREYANPAPPRVRRIAAFGDSFVYGNEVDTRDAWTSAMESLFLNTEVLNYGVGGYGVDQAYLRYQAEGRTFAPRTVLIGFVSDDMRRIVNVYRRFIADNERPLAKPRFVFGRNDSLQLLEAPLRDSVSYAKLVMNPRDVRKLGKHDAWYEAAIYENPVYDYSATVRLMTTLWVRLENRYFARDRLVVGSVFNTSATAYRLQLAVFERFAAEVARDGSQPLVVLFPDRGSLAAELEGRDAIYAPLRADLARLGVPYADLSGAFLESARAEGISPLFMSGGHYSPAGNSIAARAIGAALELTAP